MPIPFALTLRIVAAKNLVHHLEGERFASRICHHPAQARGLGGFSASARRQRRPQKPRRHFHRLLRHGAHALIYSPFPSSPPASCPGWSSHTPLAEPPCSDKAWRGLRQ